MEVALSGQADAIVTGNLRHFPASLGVTVLSPRALIDRLDAEPRPVAAHFSTHLLVVDDNTSVIKSQC